MGRSAMSKLQEADTLTQQAGRLIKSDPESSRELKELARAKRRSAIKQMKRRPKPNKHRVVL